MRARYNRGRENAPHVENTATPHDKHHCRCFIIDKSLILWFKNVLISDGFERQVFEDYHGQAFGLRKRLSEHKQIHVKVMPDGLIEAEMEPPPEYPPEHLDHKYSYSPHSRVLRILRDLKMGFKSVRPTPPTCKKPVVVHPKHYTSWKEVVGVAVLVCIGLGLLGYALHKSR